MLALQLQECCLAVLQWVALSPTNDIARNKRGRSQGMESDVHRADGSLAGRGGKSVVLSILQALYGLVLVANWPR